MRIRMKSLAAGPNYGTLLPGEVYDLPPAVAKDFIAGGYAEAAPEPPPAPKPAIELPPVPAPETAGDPARGTAETAAAPAEEDAAAPEPQPKPPSKPGGPKAKSA